MTHLLRTKINTGLVLAHFFLKKTAHFPFEETRAEINKGKKHVL